MTEHDEELRHGPLPASDWLATRARAQAQRGDNDKGRGVRPPFPTQVMAHLRECVRLPGDP